MVSSVSNAMLPLTGGVNDAVIQATQRVNALGKKAPMTSAQAETASKDFESMFLSQMMESMFGESTGTDSFGDEDTNEIYRSMMMTEYSKQITAGGGIGIADYIKSELLKTQEV